MLVLDEIGTVVRKHHKNLILELPDQQPALYPIESLLCFGGVRVTPDALAAISSSGNACVFLSHSGRFLSRVSGVHDSALDLRLAQCQIQQDPERRLTLATRMIEGKIRNQFHVLRRRDRPTKSLTNEVTSLDQLRGVEGAAAAHYFQNFPTLPEGFSIVRRTKRPPKDPTNAMLSYGYAILHGVAAAALSTYGFELGLGVLHEVRPGRLSLACDLMEEFRAPIVDRTVIKLINRKQVKLVDFDERLQLNKRVRSLIIEEIREWFDVVRRQAGLLRNSLLTGTTYVPFSLEVRTPEKSSTYMKPVNITCKKDRGSKKPHKKTKNSSHLQK